MRSAEDSFFLIMIGTEMVGFPPDTTFLFWADQGDSICIHRP